MKNKFTTAFPFAAILVSIALSALAAGYPAA